MIPSLLTLKISVLLILFSFANHLSGQTTLINPTMEGGFETGTGSFGDNGWTVVNHTVNAWYSSSVPVPSSGANAAFISNTAGSSHMYDRVIFQTSHFYRDITVPAGEKKITLSYKWKAGGQLGFDRLLVYLAPTTVTPVAGIPTSTSTVIDGATLISGTSLHNQTSYQTVTTTLPASFAGTTFRLIFTWQNNDFDGSNPPGAIDEISLISEVAPTYTWNATMGSAAWNMAANWTPERTTPTVFDILQFSNGGNSIVTIPSGSTGGNVEFSNNTVANFQASAANTLTLTSLTIDNGSSLFLNGTTAQTLAFSALAINNIHGRFEIANTAGLNTFNFNNSITTIGSTGVLAAGTTIAGTPWNGPSANLIINGTYEHKYTITPGTIPTATWGSNSNCNIIGYTTSTLGIAGLAQNFSNFTWNCPNQTSNANMVSSSVTGVSGTFSVINTGTGECRWTATGGYTLNITNFFQSGGTFDLVSGSTSSTITFNVSGTFNQTGGVFRGSGSNSSNVTLHFNGTGSQSVSFSSQPTGPFTYRFSNPAGVTINGNFASLLNVGNGFRGGVRISTSAPAPISFGGTLTGFSYNQSNNNSFLTYDVADNITATSLEFPEVDGPTRLTVNVGTNNVLTLPFNRTVPGFLTMISGDIDLAANNLTLGASPAVPGILTWTSGNIRITSGSFTRWYQTSALPISAGTDVGFYPIANGLHNRNVSIFFSVSNALSTGGTITVSHTNAGGITGITPFADGSYTVDFRANSSWQISTGDGISASGTLGLRLTGGNALSSPTPVNLRVLQGETAAGSHINGGGTEPNFQASRNGLTLAQINATHHIGAGATDIFNVYNSVASGDWADPSIWDANEVPSCTGSVTIQNGNNVVINSTSNFALNVRINSGGLLTMTNGDLTVGCTRANANFEIGSGTFNMQGGTLMVNGRLRKLELPTGQFIQSGGEIIVDGNNGIPGESVTLHIVELVCANASMLNFTGGTLTIVDPVASAGSGNCALRVFPYSGLNVSSGPGWQLNLGNGSVTNNGGHSNGYVLNLTGQNSATFKISNLRINTGLGGINRHVNPIEGLIPLHHLTINSGEYRTGTTHFISGDIQVETNGTLTWNGIINFSEWNGNAGTQGSVPQQITNNGVIRNSNNTVTANLHSLALNNAGGLTLHCPLSISNSLLMTKGIIHTSATNTLHLGGFSFAAALATQSVFGNDTYINGPFSRTFTTGTANNAFSTNTNLFPVGKGGVYYPVWVSPTSIFQTVFTAEVFNDGLGIPGQDVSNLSNNRWAVSVNIPDAITNVHIQIGDGNLVSSRKLLQAPTAAGTYSGITTGSLFTSGTPNTLRTNTNSLPINTADFTGFFKYGDLVTCSAPTAQPTSITFSAVSRTSLTGMFTAPAPAPSGYLVVRYPTGATPVSPADGTVYNTGQSIGTGVIVAMGPSTTFNNAGLNNNTTYDYYIYSYNAFSCSGPVYLTTNPLIGTVTTCNTVVNQISGLINTDRTQTTLNIQWTASSTPNVSYFIDVATDAGFTNIVQFNIPAGTGTTYQITGLTAGINYHFRVRALDPVSGCFSTNIAAQQNTLCPATTIPYSENLDGLTRCLSRINAGTGSTWSFITPPAATGLTGNAASIPSNSSNPTNSYLVTRAVNLTGGTSYDLKFRYVNGSSTAAFSIDMIYSAANPVNGGIVLANNIVMGTQVNINNTVPQMASYSFTPASSGVYYLMFRAFGPAITTSTTLYIDDIIVDITPPCSTVLNSNIASSVTGFPCGQINTTTLTANGYSYSLGMSYQWEKSSDGINFTGMGTVISHPLQPNAPFVSDVFTEGQNYYRLRSTCANGPVTAYSNVAGPVVYNNPQPNTTTDGTRCGIGTVNLSCTLNPEDDAVWYANQTGGLPLGTTPDFTTPVISSTTNYFVEVRERGSSVSGGRLTNLTSGNALSDVPRGILITTTGPHTISSLGFLCTGPAANITVALYNANGTVLIQSTPVSIPANGGTTTNPVLVEQSVSLIVPGAGNYRLLVTAIDVSSAQLFWEPSVAGYPYAVGGGMSIIASVTSLTGSGFTNVYYYFYKITAYPVCEGVRTMVTANVTPPPALTLSSTAETICAGSSTPVVSITSEINDFDTYTWSPMTGVTGNQNLGYTFSSAETTTYTLTASQNNPPLCVNMANLTVTVNPVPEANIIPTGQINLNCGDVQPLTAINQVNFSDYIFTPSSGTFSPITGGTSVSSIIADNAYSAPIPIGFDFIFENTLYSNVIASSNGWLSFNPAVNNSVPSNNSTPPSTILPLLAPLWDDLSGSVTNSADASYITTGTAPNRVFTMQWLNWRWSWQSSSQVISFQVKLYESSNRIEFIYRQELVLPFIASASIGIMSAASNYYMLDGTGTNPNALSNTFTTTLSTRPANGQVYAFERSAAANYVYNWSGPSGTLWQDMAATNPYTGQNLAKVYAKPVVSGTSTYFVTINDNGCEDTATKDIVTSGSCNVSLNLTAFIEGYMNGSSMRPVLQNSGVPGATASQADTITVSLHNNTSPYAKAYEFKGVLGTNGTLNCTFPPAASGGNYYIVVTHRNALETWSASPMIFTGTNTYNFSTAATQAYGSNMVQVGGNWCFYSGDIDGDGEVLPADYTLWLISNINGDIGYFETDLDGDGEVLPGDYTIWLINNSSGILISRP